MTDDTIISDDHGVVVSLGEFKVRRKKARFTDCDHKHLTLDASTNTIKCDDCGEVIDPFMAFYSVMNEFNRAWDDLNYKRKKLRDEAEQSLRLRAAVKMQELWRRRKTVPLCPHCSEPLLPEHAFRMRTMGREFAIRRIEAKETK